MPKKAAEIVVEQQGVEINVTVKDDVSGDYLSDALVTLTHLDGHKETAASNPQGICRFDKLPPGKFSVHVSRANYEEKIIDGLVYEEGYKVNLSVNLKSYARS